MGADQSLPIPKEEDCVEGYIPVHYTVEGKRKEAIATLWIPKQSLPKGETAKNPDKALYYADNVFVADILSVDEKIRVVTEAEHGQYQPSLNTHLGDILTLFYNGDTIIHYKKGSWARMNLHKKHKNCNLRFPYYITRERAIEQLAIEKHIDTLSKGKEPTEAVVEYMQNGDRRLEYDPKTKLYNIFQSLIAYCGGPQGLITIDEMKQAFITWYILTCFDEKELLEFNSGKRGTLWFDCTRPRTELFRRWHPMAETVSCQQIETALKKIMQVPFTVSIKCDKYCSGKGWTWCCVTIHQVLEPDVLKPI
jgi:hypothetical protein